MEILDSIENLTVLAELSRSDQFVVYKGLDTTVDRFVLVKVLVSNSLPSGLARADSEAKLLARLSHPNIPTLYSYKVKDNQAVIITEYVDGENLRDIVEEVGLLPEPVALYIVAELAKALKAAHGADILHRDINPSNVLISQSGDVKLADFGIGSILGSLETDIKGTPGYLAPEVLLGEPSTFQSDQFSIGATLFYMLVGSPPFPGISLSAVIENTVGVDPMNRFDLLTLTSDHTRSLCSKLLGKKPETRFDTSADLCEETADIISTHNFDITATEFADFLSEPGAWKLAGEVELGATADNASDTTYSPINVLRDSKTVRRDTASERSVFLKARRFSLIAFLLVGITFALIVIIDFYPTDSTGTNQQEDSTIVTGTSGSIIAATPGADDAEDEEPELLNESQDLSDSTANQSLFLQSDPVNDNVSPTGQNAAVEVKSFGYLAVSVTPWAKVQANDSLLGTTPFESAIMLETGEYEVVFENPIFPDLQREVKIVSNETTFVDTKLWDTVNRLTIEVSPWAEVVIDGQIRDTIPPQTDPFILSPGIHQVTLSHPTLGTKRIRHLSQAGIIDTVIVKLANQVD